MKEQKKDKIRKDLLTAGIKMLHEEGYEKITVRKLAKATGTSYTSLYYYFRDLSDLFHALRETLIEEMICEIREAVLTDEDPLEEVVLLFDTYASYFLVHPEVFRFLYFYQFQLPAGDEHAKVMDERFQNMWQSSFKRLLEADVLRQEELPFAAKSIIFMIHGRILLHLSSQDGISEQQMKSEINSLIRYILRTQ